MEKKLRVRQYYDIQKYRNNNENYATTSSDDQDEVEESVSKKLRELSLSLKIDPHLPEFYRRAHVNYLNKSLRYLPSNYEGLDASRTWLCYWILHVLSLLRSPIPDDFKTSIASFLAKCQSSEGGFGGGPGHYPHLAPTYAAVNSIIILNTTEAFNVINRETLLKFLWSLREQDGSFRMHKDGEIDIRGIYCALTVAILTNVLSKELCEGTAEWIASCQTYEGGFSGYPGLEAHGGYTFCGLASLVMLEKTHLCDSQALLRWLVNRQMKFEGGFQGRTNKLVDGCYSFWQGGAFPLIYNILAEEDLAPEEHLFDEVALQEYILSCCQCPDGGLLDKPGKPRDIYHTCYTVSGLSVAQHFNNDKSILGYRDNEVACVHPVFNIKVNLVRSAFLYFNQLPCPTISLNNKIREMM